MTNTAERLLADIRESSTAIFVPRSLTSMRKSTGSWPMGTRDDL